MGWDDTTPLSLSPPRTGAAPGGDDGALRKEGCSVPRDFGVRVTRVPLQFMARDERREGNFCPPQEKALMGRWGWKETRNISASKSYGDGG